MRIGMNCDSIEALLIDSEPERWDKSLEDGNYK